MNRPCPIHSGQGGPRVDSASPIAIIAEPKITVQRVPTRPAMRPIMIPPSPEPSQTVAVASAGTDAVPLASAAMSLNATGVIQPAPKVIRIATSAAVATVQDSLVSMEGKENSKPAGGAVVQPAQQLTTLISDCAMRQNARYQAAVKLPSVRPHDNEIDPMRAGCEPPPALQHVSA